MSATDWGSVIPVILGTIAVMAGWPIVHHFNLRREIAADKRKLRVSYLLEAYRKLKNAGNRSIRTESEHARAIESAIADIQLLGTPAQVNLAQEFAIDFANNGTASLDMILQSLRASLRAELELEEVGEILKFLRTS